MQQPVVEILVNGTGEAGRETHSIKTEFRHDCLQGPLILLEEETELFIFVEKRLVLDDGLGICTLQFRLKCFCTISFKMTVTVTQC